MATKLATKLVEWLGQKLVVKLEAQLAIELGQLLEIQSLGNLQQQLQHTSSLRMLVNKQLSKTS